MDREQLVRSDFPAAHGANGFDIDSVGAHLAAVAAHVAALEARIVALEVEREALRRQLAAARDEEKLDLSATSAGESVTGEAVTFEHDEIAAEEPGAGAAIAAAAPDSPSAEAVASLEPERGNEEPGAVTSGDPAAPGDGVTSGDEVAARLLATKLAMEGKSRDTIVMQLAAEHDVADPGALVEDILTRLA